MSSYKRSKLDNVVVVGIVRSENYKYIWAKEKYIEEDRAYFLHFENICIILRASSILYFPRKCTLSPSNFMLALPRDIYAYCYRVKKGQASKFLA